MVETLTPKQARFVERYLISLNGSLSYKEAYPHVKNDKTAKAAASRLLTNVNVGGAIAQAQMERQERTRVTQDTVINDLTRISRKAEADRRYGDALKALEMLAKHVGLFSDNVDFNINTPPALHVHFTKPQEKISAPEMPALEQGLDVVGQRCQCSACEVSVDNGLFGWEPPTVKSGFVQDNLNVNYFFGYPTVWDKMIVWLERSPISFASISRSTQPLTTVVRPSDAQKR